MKEESYSGSNSLDNIETREACPKKDIVRGLYKISLAIKLILYSFIIFDILLIVGYLLQKLKLFVFIQAYFDLNICLNIEITGSF